MSKATVSTHVIDVSLGQPAPGIPVMLSLQPRQLTDTNGRIADLTDGGIDPGTYRLVFDLAGYFGDRPHLFERVALDLRIGEGKHHHVPLLIAPFSYSSYRGS